MEEKKHASERREAEAGQPEQLAVEGVHMTARSRAHVGNTELTGVGPGSGLSERFGPVSITLASS